MHQRRWDGARGRSPSFPGRLKTPAFLSVVALQLSGWFLVFHMPFKLEAVFRSWERFHLPSNTWPREGREYRPHHTVILGAFDLCNIILNRWIKQDESTVKNKRACWRVQGIYRTMILHAFRSCDFILCCWIWRGESTLKDKCVGPGEGYLPCLFRFMVGIGGFRANYMLEGYPPVWTQNPYRVVLISSSGPILILKCLRVFTTIWALSVWSLRVDRMVSDFVCIEWIS